MTFLQGKEYSGIRETVEEKLYPDKAHFIYEPLQYAEDANATEASFELYTDRLVFCHNGNAFSKNDLLGITNIGLGTKSDKDDKISGLVLLEEIGPIPGLDGWTKFKFPFNNSKKQPESCYEEIRTGLDELAEKTLIFLTNLEAISWHIGEADSGDVLKIQYSDRHIGVLKELGGKPCEECHFLKFSAPVRGLEKHNVAIAFELDLLPGVTRFDSGRPIAGQLRISPASPGRVAVFFPTEKEISGLRFHLHAPFVPELNRASVKETPKNESLFDQLAELAASSLHEIRELGLLTPEFLGVLPNVSDQIPARYRRVREAIVEEMKTQQLTPVYGENGHAAASCMLQGRATLKNLLTNEDLAFFHGTAKYWVVSATQGNNEVDRFFQQLDIQDWDTDDLLSHIDDALTIDDSEERYFDANDFRNWLSAKTTEWHQQFYAVLSETEVRDQCHPAKRIPIVRLANGKYGSGKDCFFPDDRQCDAADAGPIQIVDAEVYTLGKNKRQQDDAKKFLEAIGVRSIGEVEIIETIPKQRYRDFEDDDTLEHAKKFALMPQEEQVRVLADFEEPEKFQLPEHEPSKPDRRAQRVGAMAAEAPSRKMEVRDRSVAVGLSSTKEEAKRYLSHQYTDPAGEMICQACRKPLPFKLDNGISYFESIEFLELKKHHHQNYLALCPNHAAMFRHANGSRDRLKDMVIQAHANEIDEIELILARRPTQVYFTKTHLFDLWVLIQVELGEGES